MYARENNKIKTNIFNQTRKVCISVHSNICGKICFDKNYAKRYFWILGSLFLLLGLLCFHISPLFVAIDQ